MRRSRLVGLGLLAALALPAVATAAEPPPDPSPLWSQFPLEPTTPVPGTVTPETDTAPQATAEPPATTAPDASTAPASSAETPAETAPAQTAPAETGPPASSSPTAPAGSVEEAPAVAVPPPAGAGRDLTWLLVGLAALLMIGSVAFALRRNARTAPARRPTQLVPVISANVERCTVVVERSRGHARFAAVVEDPEGNEHVVARSPAFRAAAGKAPQPDGRPLLAYETLMDALAEERWRRTGAPRPAEDGPERGSPEWYEEQLERIAAARARTRRRAAP